MLYDKLFWVTQHISLLTPDRDPMAHESMDATKVQLDEPICFVGVTYRNMDDGLLLGAEKTPRELDYQSPPEHG